MKKIRIYSLLFLVLLAVACNDTLDFYLGVYQQPEFVENTYEPGLNVFGIIRPDNMNNYNLSFVHLQRVLPAIGDTVTEFEVDTAYVTVNSEFRPDSLIVFEYTDMNSTFDEEQYRPPIGFTPQPGNRYTLYCDADTLPILTGSTIMPNKPSIIPEQPIIENGCINFTIEPDSLAFMYDIYLLTGGSSYFIERKKAETDQEMNVEIPMGDIADGEIHVYAYDENMAQYYLTSNISLNFNKYRTPYSTVDGGYGVFGSLNYVVIKF